MVYPNLDGYRLSNPPHTTITILLEGNTVGAIQRLEVTDEKHISGWAGRARIDRRNLGDIFTLSMPRTSAQRVPLDILITDRVIKKDNDKPYNVRTQIKNVWISEIPTSYTADDFVIFDQLKWEAEEIHYHPALILDEEIIKDIIE